MSATPALGEFEQVVLLAILRLADNAYGVTIRREITACTEREPAPGALYTTLDRLETKGLLRSRLGDADASRGGRPRRYLTVTPAGLSAVRSARAAIDRLSSGLDLTLASPRPSGRS
jgi:PadR family transcriptional regulator, regulatory protein PadR